MKVPQQKLDLKPFLGWWLFAIICRFISCETFSHWFHPDEWCQTIEPANLIAHGFTFHSQEIGLHLRNLTWPVLLAGVLKFSQWISPNSIDFRIGCVNFLCGSLDLLIFWGWLQLLKENPFTKNLSQKLKNWSLALLLLPWYTLYGAVNPRAEHVSEIAFWVALGCITRRFWFLGGLASVAVFAVRYPSGLLTLTLCLFLFIKNLLPKGPETLAGSVSKKRYTELIRFSLGIFLGLGIFGIADWAIYGRPWESLWMYFQYNLFSGISTRIFGQQGISAYAEYFAWNWGNYRILIPLGIVLACGSLYGFWRGLREKHLWAYCLAVYLLGHCLVPHKEARFLVPVETLMRWSAFVGIVLFLKDFKILKKLQNSILNNLALSFLWISVLANCLIFLSTLRADFWKDLGTYRELKSHLESNPQTCGILTVREVSSILIPFRDPAQMPDPPLGSFKTDPEQQNYQGTKHVDILWTERSPHCNSTDHILLHVHRAEPEWPQEGCDLLPSGLLNLLPTHLWDWAVHHRLAAGSWYSCPPAIVNHFHAQKVTHIYSHSFGKIETLPALGASAEELQKLGFATSPPPPDVFVPTLENPGLTQ